MVAVGSAEMMLKQPVVLLNNAPGCVGVLVLVLLAWHAILFQESVDNWLWSPWMSAGAIHK